MNEPIKITVKIKNQPWEVTLIPGMGDVVLDMNGHKVTIPLDTPRPMLVLQLLECGRDMLIQYLAETPSLVTEMIAEAQFRRGSDKTKLN